MNLFHYIVVRRDLPLGAVLAHVAHAAGESFGAFCLQTPDTREAYKHFGQTTVVVLGARNEVRLRKLSADLQRAKVPHVAFTESDGPLAGQMTAIGLVPSERETVRPYVSDFDVFPSTAHYE